MITELEDQIIRKIIIIKYYKVLRLIDKILRVVHIFYKRYN